MLYPAAVCEQSGLLKVERAKGKYQYTPKSEIGMVVVFVPWMARGARKPSTTHFCCHETEDF
jgi:hypothetical protein